MRQIIIIHQSAIIREGLCTVLKQGLSTVPIAMESISDLDNFVQNKDKHLIIGSKNNVDQLKLKYPELNYMIIASDSLSRDHASINILDKMEVITKKVESFSAPDTASTNSINTKLTERETEVLILLAFGHANKEIAEKLFISTHTVISHRKNITEKLGIKSVSGLTVYAIINNLIDTEGINPDDLI